MDVGGGAELWDGSGPQGSNGHASTKYKISDLENKILVYSQVIWQRVCNIGGVECLERWIGQPSAL